MSEQNNDLLRRVFGMLQDNVRIYQIAEDREVFRDEFQYCQVMYQILFGDKGFVDTLGPTWRMIHDPRFITIENMMVVERKAIFGGDARLGRQYFNDDGAMSSTVSDLEKYSELLGEGRNFLTVLTHPDAKCQKRMWLERIYTGYTNIKPHEGFGCTCESKSTDASQFYKAPDEDVWALIKQECPNRAFTKGGNTTAYGKQVFNLIRADLIGLIYDYAETPLIDSYVYLRDHGVVTATETVAYIDPHGQEAPRVLQEIDILEQALTHRATLRVTAFKILKKIGFEQKLRQLTGTDFFELTDIERDELLRIVYEDDYPEADPKLNSADFPRDGETLLIPKNWRPFTERLHEWEQALEVKLLDYVRENCMGIDYSMREVIQLAIEQNKAQQTIVGLLNGSIQPINSYTEPTAEIPADQTETEVMKYSAMMEAIISNEFKQELYLLLVDAEKVNDTAIIDILSPVFMTPDYPLDEQGFYQILERIRIGSKSLRAERMDAIRGTQQTGNTGGNPEVQQTEGEFHSKDNPGGIYRN